MLKRLQFLLPGHREEPQPQCAPSFSSVSTETEAGLFHSTPPVSSLFSCEREAETHQTELFSFWTGAVETGLDQPLAHTGPVWGQVKQLE